MDQTLDQPLQTVELDLELLRHRCLLVAVSVRGTGIFTHSNNFSELGIADEDIRIQRYTGGSKFLYPKKIVSELHAIESGVRKALDDLSTDLESFRPWRVMKHAAIPKWRERYTHFRSRMEAFRAECLAVYDKTRDALAAEFAESARRSWMAAQSQGYSALVFNGKTFLTQDAYVDHVVNMALSRFPTREDIEAITIEYRAARVSSQADIEADYLQAAQLRAQRETAQATAQADQDRIHADTQHHLRLLQIEQNQREQQAQAMIHAEIERARESLKNIKSPLEEAVEGLRGRIAADCQKMLATIQNSGVIHGKIAEQGAGLIELYQLLSITDDVKLRDMLLRLKSDIGPIGSQRPAARDTEQIKACLSQIIEIASEEIDLVSATSRANFIDFA